MESMALKSLVFSPLSQSTLKGQLQSDKSYGFSLRPAEQSESFRFKSNFPKVVLHFESSASKFEEAYHNSAEAFGCSHIV